MGFGGHSLWERIGIVKSSVSIPVIGNGDIGCAADAKAMYDQTGCDSIMIGRAALGNPWIFNQIKHLPNELQHREDAPSAAVKLSVIKRHIKRFYERYGERKASTDLKKHLAWYCKGISCAASLRNEIFKATTVNELETAIISAFRTNKGD
jgi:tRNA-dihydrouridine synthase